MLLKYYAATAAGALALLITTREELFKNNLADNGWGTRASEKVDCDPRSAGARTEDGSCNDPSQPLMGAVDVPLGRNVRRPAVLTGDKVQLLEPNPISVSRELLRREGQIKPLPLNLLVTAWIQFQNHDWFDHNNTELNFKSYIKVPIPQKYRAQFQQDGIMGELKSAVGADGFMVVPKTKAVGKNDKEGSAYEVFSNNVTHWWDGSQLYGSTGKISARLREFKNGRMRMAQGNLLPLAQKDEVIDDPKLGYRTEFQAGIEETGFSENWWIGMSLLHNLFVRNHNLIVSDPEFRKQVEDMIREPGTSLSRFERGANRVVGVSRDSLFDGNRVKDRELYEAVLDQMLYDKARLVNTAIIAKIHTIEWTPAVFDTTPLDLGMNANWSGLLEGQFDKHVTSRKFWNEVKKAADKVGIMNITRQFKVFGLMGGNRNLYNVPFTITEEFTSVYRLHSLLPESIDLRDSRDSPKGALPIKDTRLEKSAKVLEEHGLGEMFYSFGHTRPGQLVLGNYPRFLQDLEVPIVGKLDMGAIDILRDRERGVPRYNEFRRQIYLQEIASFPDLFAYNSKLKFTDKECHQLETESLALEQAGLGFFKKASLWAYQFRSRTGRLTDFDLKHCRLQKMQLNFDRYAAEFAKPNPDQNKLAELKKKVMADIAEREAGLTEQDKVYVQRLRALYNTESLRKAFQTPLQASLGLADNVEALDLMVGTHAESFRNPPEPKKGMIGLGLGETQFQIFVLMASRRFLADRFFTELYRPEVYTKRGVDLVETASMKGVLACNIRKEFPQIEEALKCTRSAFHPWNAVSKSEANCGHPHARHEKNERDLINKYKSLCAR